MKAFPIRLLRAQPVGIKEKLDHCEMMEAIILSSPPGGSTTEQVIKSGILYNAFREEAEKNVTTDEWTCFLSKENYTILLAQLDSIRWTQSSPEMRMAIIDFIKGIKESKEELINVKAAS